MVTTLAIFQNGELGAKGTECRWHGWVKRSSSDTRPASWSAPHLSAMTEGTCPRCHGSGQARSPFEVVFLDTCLRCGGTGMTKNPTEPTDDFRLAVLEAEHRGYERGVADGRGRP